MEFVYNVASGPKYKSTFDNLGKFSIPFTGLVYLTPEVSTYIPILVISESCCLSWWAQSGLPHSSVAWRSIILVPPVWILLEIVMFLAQSPAFTASVSTLKIGVSTPSTVILVKGTSPGLVIVVPTPVVLGFPELPSSIELSVPPYKSVPPCPLDFPAVTAAEVLYSESSEDSIFVTFPELSNVNCEPSVTIPVEPCPRTSILP